VDPRRRALAPPRSARGPIGAERRLSAAAQGAPAALQQYFTGPRERRIRREIAQRELPLLAGARRAPAMNPPLCLPIYLSTDLPTYPPSHLSLSIYNREIAQRELPLLAGARRRHTHNTHTYIYIYTHTSLSRSRLTRTPPDPQHTHTYTHTHISLSLSGSPDPPPGPGLRVNPGWACVCGWV